METHDYLYNAVSLVLAVVAVTALVLCIAYFIGGFVGWKTPYRKRRFVRSAVCLVAVPICIGLQYLYLWQVYMPALGRITQAEYDARLKQRLEETTFVMKGDQAPDFDLTDTDGELFSLSDQRGKVVLVNFFATWCGPCLLELPHLEELWKRRQSDDRFTMLVIGREESSQTVQGFRASKGYTFPMAADPERKVYDLFAKEGIPRTVLISEEGEVLFSTLGFYEQDLAKLEQLLNEHLAPLD